MCMGGWGAYTCFDVSACLYDVLCDILKLHKKQLTTRPRARHFGKEKDILTVPIIIVSAQSRIDASVGIVGEIGDIQAAVE